MEGMKAEGAPAIVPDAHGEEPLVLRTDQGAVTTLTLNRPRQFNALSSAMLAALQMELDKDRRRRVGARRRAGGRGQGILRGARSQRDAQPPGQGLPECTLPTVQPDDVDDQPPPTARHRPRAWAGDGGRLPAGGSVRPGGGGGFGPVCHVGYPRRAILLDAIGSSKPQFAAQEGARNSAHGRVYRRADGSARG